MASRIRWNCGSMFFESMLDRFCKPSWDQNEMKNRCQLRKADFHKNKGKPLEKSMIFWFWVVEVRSQNRSISCLKITSKNQSFLAPILERFGWLRERPRAARSRPRANKSRSSDAPESTKPLQNPFQDGMGAQSLQEALLNRPRE